MGFLLPPGPLILAFGMDVRLSLHIGEDMITSEPDVMIAEEIAMEKNFVSYVLEDIPSGGFVGRQRVLDHVLDSFVDVLLMERTILDQF